MEEWSRFWRQGHTTTFGDYFDNGYAGPVKAWLDTLADPILEADEPINIAELCCGNGSLLPFLFSLGKTFHYTGVDAAEVQLPEVLHASVEQAEGSVQLLGNTPAEDTTRDGSGHYQLSVHLRYGVQRPRRHTGRPLAAYAIRRASVCAHASP